MSGLGKIKRWSIIAPLILFLVTFLIYLHNLSSSVYGGDVGDFLIAVAVKGVAHPSGYPLFTIIGIILSYIPLNQTLAWKVGLISAFFSSLAVVLMYLISKLLTKNVLVSIITALTLAFYYTFWLYAEVAEVFALNNFFILLLLFFSLLYFKKKKIKFLYFLIFFAGLSLSNHEVILLIFPSLFVLMLKTDWKILLEPKTLLKCLLLFFLGFLPYVYIPFAALNNPSPPLDWVGKVTFENILKVILRQDYGWAPSKIPFSYIHLLSLKTYFKVLLIGLTPAVVINSVLGMIYLLKKRSINVFLFLISAFILTGPVAIFYVNTPIFSSFTFGVLERFYMISALILLIFFPFGILFIVGVIQKVLTLLSFAVNKKTYYKNHFYFIFFIIPISLFMSNYPKTDLHNVWNGDYLAMDALLSLPQKSTLFLSGDTILFDTIYLQHALGVRKDVIVINIGRIEKDKNYLRRKEEISREKNIPKDSLDAYTLVSLLNKNNVFSNVSIGYKNKKFKNPNWMPYGLLLKSVVNGKEINKALFINQQDKILNSFRFAVREKKLSEKNSTISEIPTLYSQAYVNTGNYLVSEYSDEEKAREYYQKAISFAPEESGGYMGLGYYYLSKNDCENAEKTFNKVISLNPGNKSGYVLLYATYDDCFKDVQKTKLFAKDFYSLFKTSIIEEMKKEITKE
ncbi:MAG: DUF2723 domain-containing protein [Candidatus Levybacteria bacterium]|nr:DUF2723 domain-containing protein [Candidatus Levybacteria bacterium]